MTSLFSECLDLLKGASADLEGVCCDAAGLRRKVGEMGFFSIDGLFVHDSVEEIRTKGMWASVRAEAKLDRVASIADSSQFPADEVNQLVSAKSAVHALNSSLERDLAAIQREVQDNTLFGAARGIWEEIRSFTQRIALKLTRVTIRATRQIAEQVRRLLE